MKTTISLNENTIFAKQTQKLKYHSSIEVVIDDLVSEERIGYFLSKDCMKNLKLILVS